MELEILRQLETAHPRALKAGTVMSECERAVDGFTITAFNRALVVLERKSQIRVEAGEDVTRLRITDDGLNRLAALR